MVVIHPGVERDVLFLEEKWNQFNKPSTLSPIVMEVENCCKGNGSAVKVTTSNEMTHFSLPLWEEWLTYHPPKKKPVHPRQTET